MGNVILEQFDGIICEYHVNSNVKPLGLHIKTYGITWKYVNAHVEPKHPM